MTLTRVDKSDICGTMSAMKKENRTHTVAVRFTEAEMQALRDSAAAQGMTASVLVRQAVMSFLLQEENQERMKRYREAMQ